MFPLILSTNLHVDNAPLGGFKRELEKSIISLDPISISAS
jgi:hypothetical protein